MGGLTGSPKAPKSTTKVVYMPSPATVAADAAAESAAETEKEILAERANNVLQRSRSRLGTVISGFRGVLSQNDLTVQRKTLLGE